MDELILVRGLEWTSLVLSLIGITLGSYFAFDNYRDLKAYKSQSGNGFAKLAASISIRSGLAKAGLHSMLTILPALSLTTSPPTYRYTVAVIFFLALGLGQLFVVLAQFLNWLDRLRLIKTLEGNH